MELLASTLAGGKRNDGDPVRRDELSDLLPCPNADHFVCIRGTACDDSPGIRQGAPFPGVDWRGVGLWLFAFAMENVSVLSFWVLAIANSAFGSEHPALKELPGPEKAWSDL